MHDHHREHCDPLGRACAGLPQPYRRRLPVRLRLRPAGTLMPGESVYVPAPEWQTYGLGRVYTIAAE